jgi:hypothetical protein
MEDGKGQNEPPKLPMASTDNIAANSTMPSKENST